jgi:hypothetical protein
MRGDNMIIARIAISLLIMASVLGLEYGSSSSARKTYHAAVGPIELSLKHLEKVNVLAWAGFGAIVIGGSFVFFGKRRVEVTPSISSKARKSSLRGRRETNLSKR